MLRAQLGLDRAVLCLARVRTAHVHPLSTPYVLRLFQHHFIEVEWYATLHPARRKMLVALL